MNTTVDLTPTWAAIMPAIVAALTDGTEKGRELAREELMDLARRVDALNATPRDVPAVEHEEAMSARDLSPADWLATHASVSNNADLDTEQRHRIMSELESFAESALERLEDMGAYHQFVNPETGQTFGSFQLYQITKDDKRKDGSEPGWYWQSQFPGCLPDGETSGPFESAKEAWTDAQRI